MFKEEGTDKWSGPGKVVGKEGTKIKISHMGYYRTVLACRVMPYQNKKYVKIEYTEPEISDKTEVEETYEMKDNNAEGERSNEKIGGYAGTVEDNEPEVEKYWQ